MPDDLVYHYTDLNGLLGILEEHSLWATDLGYLNDTSERTFGLPRLRQVVGNVVGGWTPWAETLGHFANVFVTIPFSRPRSFVACFSRHGDLFSQWRGYGQLGYSIGFDPIALEAIGTGSSVLFSLREVLYTTEQQEAPVKEVLGRLVTERGGGGTGAPLSNNPELYLRPEYSWALPYGAELHQLVAQFKDEAFESEREVRAVHELNASSGIEVRVRASAFGPTPFVRLDIGGGSPTTIRKIIVGPTPEKEAAREAINDLLKWRELSDVEVESSKVPFRWQ